MSDGFWSLRNAPKWWFDRRAWMGFAVMAVLMVGARWHYGPGRIPEGRVVVYGADWCGYSQALRQQLDASGIPYEMRPVDGSLENGIRFFFSGRGRGGGIPVVLVGPRVVSNGYDPQKIGAALATAGYPPLGPAAGPPGFSRPR